MPSMNGHELQDWLQRHGYHLPIIFVTAYGDAKSRERALNAGAVGYFDKSFHEVELVSCIERALPEASLTFDSPKLLS